MTEAQTNAALRHVASFGGGGIAVLTALGLLDADQAKAIIVALQQTMDGLSQATAGLAKILYIVGPLMGGAGALYAAKSANFLNQLKSVIAIASQNSDKGIEATKAVVDATATLPEVSKVVAPSIANEVPNDKVVAK